MTAPEKIAASPRYRCFAGEYEIRHSACIRRAREGAESSTTFQFMVSVLLRDAWTAAIPSAKQREILCNCSDICAASACSENLTLPLRAHFGHTHGFVR
ncbi:hypothetical protein [Ruegeria marisrubri]|uniref:hypothetical protein n=1 Tax=Ruegeria marisrubri TaxID=1685379 RepID=UPI0012FD1C3A|nr:hypothetical protein [Ruegeria marisrubri]